jgi:hypothetical protein
MGPNARPAAKCTRRNDEMLCCWHVRLEHESELFGYLKAPGAAAARSHQSAGPRDYRFLQAAKNRGAKESMPDT